MYSQFAYLKQIHALCQGNVAIFKRTIVFPNFFISATLLSRLLCRNSIFVPHRVSCLKKSRHLVTAVKPAVLSKTKWRLEENFSSRTNTQKKIMWKEDEGPEVSLEEVLEMSISNFTAINGLLSQISPVLERKPVG